MAPNNHVGNSRSREYSINDKSFSGQTTIYAQVGETITIRAEITENDKRPDWDAAFERYTITQADVEKGFKKLYDLYVMEDSGRYAGNTAHWIVTYAFTSKGQKSSGGGYNPNNGPVFIPLKLEKSKLLQALLYEPKTTVVQARLVI